MNTDVTMGSYELNMVHHFNILKKTKYLFTVLVVTNKPNIRFQITGLQVKDFKLTRHWMSNVSKKNKQICLGTTRI